MTGPYDLPVGRDIYLEVLTLGRTAALDLPAAMRTSGRFDMHINHATDKLIMRVRSDVAAEKLPPQTFTTVVDDPRWATWWDHLKATYRDRWWARAAVRRWPPRTVGTLVPVTVDVAAWWKFPDTPVPRAGLGRPVVYTTISAHNWADYQ